MSDRLAPGETVALKGGRSVRLRRGGPNDGAAILAVHRASILDVAGEPYTKAELQSWAAGLHPGGYGDAMVGGESYLLACSQAGSLAGFVSHRGDEVFGLYIHPAWARCGLGRVLLERAEAAIVDAGHRTIRIGASLCALPFYRTHGYRLVRRKPWKTRGGLVIVVADLEKSD